MENKQVGGTHYKTSYQHWDMAADAGLTGHFEGAISKYIVRWRKKDGVKDLEKALSYLDKLITLHAEHRVSDHREEPPSAIPALAKLFNAAEPPLGELERKIIIGIIRYRSTAELIEIRPVLLDLLRQANLDKLR